MAVHHPCITATAFRGIWRTRRAPRNRMVEPNLAKQEGLGRRIRLIGLLRKSLQMRVSILACITGASRDPETASCQGPGTNSFVGMSAWLSQNCDRSASATGSSESRLLSGAARVSLWQTLDQCADPIRPRGVGSQVRHPDATSPPRTMASTPSASTSAKHRRRRWNVGVDVVGCRDLHAPDYGRCLAPDLAVGSTA